MLVILLVILTLVALYWFPIRRWMNQWGATRSDLARVMAGDGLLADRTYSGTMAVIVNARPEHLWPWLVRTASQLDWAALQLYSRAADGADTRPIIFRPYRGLLAFRPVDSRFFFGRNALASELLGRVDAAFEDRAARFQLVIGASGSGKSSLVLSGLLQDGARTFGRGDLALPDPYANCSPEAVGSEACLCLVVRPGSAEDPAVPRYVN